MRFHDLFKLTNDNTTITAVMIDCQNYLGQILEQNSQLLHFQTVLWVTLHVQMDPQHENQQKFLCICCLYQMMMNSWKAMQWCCTLVWRPQTLRRPGSGAGTYVRLGAAVTYQRIFHKWVYLVLVRAMTRVQQVLLMVVAKNMHTFILKKQLNTQQ